MNEAQAAAIMARLAKLVLNYPVNHITVDRYGLIITAIRHENSHRNSGSLGEQPR